MNNRYDAIIIGAGMSGLAAGIRLAMFDKKVVILEKHNIAGGLNSYYQRRIPSTKELFQFDVGLHALTNFAKKGEKKKPFSKLLKQLRIPYDDFKLQEQTYSLIKFQSAELKFSNDFDLLLSEVNSVFPNEIDSFNRFCSYVNEYNEVDLEAKYISARSVLDQYFKEDLLKEMLIAPLLIYGSAWEDDMDFSQFVIMFKSLYFEGFSRPSGGVRTIIDLLIDKFERVGGELVFRAHVEKINTDAKGKISGITLKKGEILNSLKVFSSAGLPETLSLLEINSKTKHDIGKLSFTESILVTEDKTSLKDYDPTIVFYNSTDKYQYRKPSTLTDTRSAVFCLPDNYERSTMEGRGVYRITYMANYDLWKKLDRDEYKTQKEEVFNQAKSLTQKLVGQEINPILSDVFTPNTIERYTFHKEGTVYGSTTKTRNGLTDIKGLFIIGTDQGFLGIVGSMLSGISMANLHGLMNE